MNTPGTTHSDQDLVPTSTRRRRGRIVVDSMSSASFQDTLLDDSDSSFEGHLRALQIRGDSDDNGVKAQGHPGDDKEVVLCEDSDNNESDEDDRASTENDSCWRVDRQKKEYYLGSKSAKKSVVWPEIRIPTAVFEKLYDHQKTGVQWMATLHEGQVGGILGDDMGMGKTFMTLSYLGGLMRAKTIRNALVIAPLSVLRSWEKEAQKVLAVCVPDVRIVIVSSELQKSSRSQLLQKALRCSPSDPYLIISTYGLVRESTLDFVNDASPWDYVCLDEGHTIKNPKAQASVSCRRICADSTRRLMLTGTPILNNLKELWSLFDWATSGRVLGNLKSFNQYYGKPIEAARDKAASQSTMEWGQRVNKELQEKLQPYFLQRMKIDFLKDKLPPKSDYVVWTHLSSIQRSMYSDFLSSNMVQSILSRDTTSVLEAITWLKKLCGHPRLVNMSNVDSDSFLTADEERLIIQDSAKLGVLVELVRWLREGGHRMLIFSQSTKMLDMIQSVLTFVSLGRIDGSTKGCDRQRLVDEFNDDESGIDALLLSTKAAGVGLTLTGADRVIVYDPSWTPAEDSQAVDRCYRIGQARPVVVYRLIAAGTIEEKTYEKQVHKDGIRRTVFTQETNIQRYFDHDELRRMFTLGPPGTCEVMKRVNQVEDDGSHHDFVLSQPGVVGVSRHDGFYANPTTNVDNDEVETPKTAFGGQLQEPNKVVGRAQRVLQAEDTNVVPARRRMIQKKITDAPNRSVQREPSKPPEVIDLDDSSLEVVEVEQENAVAPPPSPKRPQPRRRLKELLDTLENGYADLDKDEKMALHEGIGVTAQTLGLFE